MCPSIMANLEIQTVIDASSTSAAELSHKRKEEATTGNLLLGRSGKSERNPCLAVLCTGGCER